MAEFSQGGVLFNNSLKITFKNIHELFSKIPDMSDTMTRRPPCQGQWRASSAPSPPPSSSARRSAWPSAWGRAAPPCSLNAFASRGKSSSPPETQSWVQLSLGTTCYLFNHFKRQIDVRLLEWWKCDDTNVHFRFRYKSLTRYCEPDGKT